MTLGDFPLYSRVTFLRLLFAAASITLRLTRALPVKATCIPHETTADPLIRRVYLVNLHMGNDCLTGSMAITSENAHEARREASLVDECTHAKSGERSEFGRLENGKAASSKRGSDLPCKHEK
jgi:hypothetical protein